MNNEVYNFFNFNVSVDFLKSESKKIANIFEIDYQNESEFENVVSEVFTELILAYESHKISIEDFVKFISNVIKKKKTASLFCQVLNVFPATEKIKSLLLLISTQSNIIKSNDLALFIRPELLLQLNVVPEKVLTKSLNIKKRDEFYSQKKFNLLHEECAGYSKFIIEMYEVFLDDRNKFCCEHSLNIVKTLIGHYSLDPNRCLDILLDIFSVFFISRCDDILNFLKKSLWWPCEEGDILSLTTLSVGGNHSAAKLIGLKLFKKSKEKGFLKVFFNMVSCFIKEGFVSFGSVYKFFMTDEEKMQLLKNYQKKKLEKKLFKAGGNALFFSAPLSDDRESTLESNTKKKIDNIKNEEDEIDGLISSNLEYQFLLVFLLNGLYWPSVYILTKHSFLVEIEPKVPILIIRLFNYMLSSLYDSINKFSKEELEKLCTPKKVKLQNSSNISNDKRSKFLTHKLFPMTKDQNLIYFYNNWNSKLFKIDTIEGFFKTVNELLKFCSFYLHKDLEFFVKICQIAKWDLLNTDINETKKHDWFNFFKNYIFTSMCLIKENSIVIDSAYEVLSLFPIESRFYIYDEYYNFLKTNILLIKIANKEAEKSTKDILKRLSNENISSLSKRLSKICYSNPIPCLSVVISQIESYDNLINLVVETVKYYNNYIRDVLVKILIMRLSSKFKTFESNNKINDPQSIQSLTLFIGKLCLLYYDKIDLKTLLSFILNFLYDEGYINLLVLKKIFSLMTGIKSIRNLTSTQIKMINCGRTLEKIVNKIIKDTRFDKLKTGSLLSNILFDLNSINVLLITLCRINDKFVLTSNEIHLKVLSNKIDNLNPLIHLFITLINFYADSKTVKNKLLSIKSFCVDYNVPYQWAFEIWRPVLCWMVSHNNNYEDTWHPELLQLNEEVNQILKPNSIHFNNGLFVTFWQLSLYDINYSSNIYDKEISKLKNNIKNLNESISINSRNKMKVEDLTLVLKENEALLENITHDNKAHFEHKQIIYKRLKKESEHWFESNEPSDTKQQYTSFLQYCVLPRAIHSSFDAIFSSSFLFEIYKINPKKFSFKILLDNLFYNKILIGTFFTFTLSEAENFGLFFADLLGWIQEEFDNFSSTDSNDLMLNEKNEIMTKKELFALLFNYHDTLLNEIEETLIFDDYMCRHNVITFLIRLLGVYPMIEDHCEKILKTIETIAINEDRDDLRLSLNALIGHMKARSKKWIHLWDFLKLSKEEELILINKRKKKLEIDNSINSSDNFNNIVPKKNIDVFFYDSKTEPQLKKNQIVEKYNTTQDYHLTSNDSNLISKDNIVEIESIDANIKVELDKKENLMIDDHRHISNLKEIDNNCDGGTDEKRKKYNINITELKLRLNKEKEKFYNDKLDDLETSKNKLKTVNNVDDCINSTNLNVVQGSEPKEDILTNEIIHDNELINKIDSQKTDIKFNNDKTNDIAINDKNKDTTTIELDFTTINDEKNKLIDTNLFISDKLQNTVTKKEQEIFFLSKDVNHFNNESDRTIDLNNHNHLSPVIDLINHDNFNLKNDQSNHNILTSINNSNDDKDFNLVIDSESEINSENKRNFESENDIDNIDLEKKKKLKLK